MGPLNNFVGVRFALILPTWDHIWTFYQIVIVPEPSYCNGICILLIFFLNQLITECLLVHSLANKFLSTALALQIVNLPLPNFTLRFILYQNLNL